MDELEKIKKENELLKKKLLAAAVAVTAVLMLGGCEGLSAKNAKGPETEESCLYITKDGSIQWVSVEHYEGGSYSKEELLDFASEKIKEYNEAKGTENSKEPVTLVSGSLENGKAVLITSYDSGESLVDFAGETGDDTMPFAEVKTGTPEELSEELKAAGIEIHGSFAVVLQGEGMVQTEGKILDADGSCTVNDGHFIKTGSGTSVIVTE